MKTGSANGWQVWLGSWQGVAMGESYRWSAWCDGDSRAGSSHSRREAEHAAKSALHQMLDAARRRTLRVVPSKEER